MNLYHLRYFVTLAHLQHYTKAAERLSITQPSLSHAIASLETELGMCLFEKEGRNVVLTKYGRIFLDYVEEALGTLDTGTKLVKSLTSPAEGKIALAFLSTLGTNFVPYTVHNFLQANPTKNIEFTFHTGMTCDILQGLKNNQYDIAFCSKIDKENDIIFTPVAKQELVLIVPSGHPLASRKAIDLEEVVPYPQIFFTKTSGLRPLIDSLFEKIGKQPHIIYEIEEDQTIAGMVAENFGIAVIPNMPILKFMNVRTIRIKSPSWERNFYMAEIKNRYLIPVVQSFKKFVMEQPQGKYLT